MVKKEVPFTFSADCLNAFNILKVKLTHFPIMISPDWSLPFERMCDVNNYVVDAVIGQRRDKHFQPIYYVGKALINAQENYTTMEKELLALVYVFYKF